LCQANEKCRFNVLLTNFVLQKTSQKLVVISSGKYLMMIHQMDFERHKALAKTFYVSQTLFDKTY
jgi:hypothetical protein